MVYKQTRICPTKSDTLNFRVFFSEIISESRLEDQIEC